MQYWEDGKFLILTSEKDVEEYILKDVETINSVSDLLQLFSGISNRFGVTFDKNKLKEKIKERIRASEDKKEKIENALNLLVSIRVFKVENLNLFELSNENEDVENAEKRIKQIIFVSWLKHLKSLLGIDNISCPKINLSEPSASLASPKSNIESISRFILFLKAIEIFNKEEELKECIRDIEYMIKDECMDFIDKILEYKDLNTSERIEKLCEFLGKKEKGEKLKNTVEEIMKNYSDNINDIVESWQEGFNVVFDILYSLSSKDNETANSISSSLYKNKGNVLCEKLSLEELKEDTNKNSNVYVIHIGRHSYLNNFESPKILYFESLSGSALHFPIIAYPSEEKKMDTFFEILENAFFRIAICDERVLESRVLYENNYYKNLLAAGVFFINRIFDFEIDTKFDERDLISIEKEEKERKLFLEYKENSFLSKLFPEDNLRLHALIIHQGILDKLDKYDIDDFIERIYTELEIPYVYVTSGRGRPYNIPKGANFIPFSSIESTILSKPHSKFLLLKQILGG